jgi:hypothetical protein
MYPDLLDDEIIAEIKGIAAGSTKFGVPLSFAQALAWNANIEMMWNWWPTVKGKPPGGSYGTITAARSSRPERA